MLNAARPTRRKFYLSCMGIACNVSAGHIRRPRLFREIFRPAWTLSKEERLLRTLVNKTTATFFSRPVIFTTKLETQPTVPEQILLSSDHSLCCRTASTEQRPFSAHIANVEDPRVWLVVLIPSWRTYNVGLYHQNYHLD